MEKQRNIKFQKSTTTLFAEFINTKQSLEQPSTDVHKTGAHRYQLNPLFPPNHSCN